MFLSGPAIQVPDWFSRMCKLNLHNTRTSYSAITDIIQADPFLRVYVQVAFEDFLSKGGLLGMLTALGAQGFRNRLAEVILHKVIENKYPDKIEIDYVQDVIDLENRFDFMFIEGNSRVFLMGMYLKLFETAAKSKQLDVSLLSIPIEIDEVLQNQRNRSEFPDWLIISNMALIETIGEERGFKIIKKYLSNIDDILNLLSKDEFDIYMANLLRYGHGISDHEFFHQSKVI